MLGSRSWFTQGGSESLGRVLEGSRVDPVGVDSTAGVEQRRPRNPVPVEHHEAVVDPVEADLLTHVSDHQSGVGLEVGRVSNRDDEVVQPVADQFARFVILDNK